MYNNILGAAHNMYSKDKANGAIWVVILCVQLHLLLIMAIIDRYLHIPTFFSLPNKYFMVIPSVSIMYLVFRYYNKDRVERIVNSFSMKNKFMKFFWEFITVCAAAVPIILFPILFSK